jgi:hypothetical protein
MTSRSLRTILSVGALGLTLALSACGGDKPSTPAESLAPSSVPASTASSSADAAAGPSLEVQVKGERIDPTNKTFEMTTGQTLTLDITSDRPGELHVHSSPAQELEFGKGRTRLEVTLNQAGQVDIEEHASDSLIARVLVK